MTDDDGDGVYSISMENLEGDIEYKYMVDYWAGQEDLIDDMVAGDVSTHRQMLQFS